MKEKIFTVLKFLFFLLFIPIVMATTIAFVEQLNHLSQVMTLYFVWGIFIYLLMHHFVVECQDIYRYGHKLVSNIFHFFSPLVKVAPFFLPIYSILILVAFYFATVLFKAGEYGRYFMFLTSLTLTMHFIFTARELRDNEQNFLKPNYFFAMSLIYVANIFIIVLILDLILKGVSFTEFFVCLTENARAIFVSVFRQLFFNN